jgi:hypothetical protein
MIEGMKVRRGDYGARDDWPIAFPCHGAKEFNPRGHVYAVYDAFPKAGTDGTRPGLGFMTLGEIRAKFGDSVTFDPSASVCDECYAACLRLVIPG